ncbi:transcriptional regulator with XRE-family HTH domain [Pararhizobium capsulatum DSM 1112]|uniref:Transcriptional regulator with XRE-family HTH domain n=1 Tax=Pararhizobium capsulatum DSM 1112 TaxID=1121113 RepID=A0ABU0BKX2_9HYPH|nr:helix-turn-helix domain-containing protein [Pararhizobium capsulatum]MDQ0318384.1 transcriptional regulator with XRE-family HTH domain [Pararhizobium capsulatum DSM 1112]
MENNDPLEAAIGERIRLLRQQRGLTLDDLATRSGVSRAMISKVERSEASPTAQLLARLCAALGTTLSRFFATDEAPASPFSRRCDQRQWRDPETGYLRRSVSPEGVDSSVDIVDVEFPPGARVVFDPHQIETGTTQHIWLFSGRLNMTLRDEIHVLEAGDCLFMALGDGHVFHNPYNEPARYAVVLNRKK